MKSLKGFDQFPLLEVHAVLRGLAKCMEFGLEEVGMYSMFCPVVLYLHQECRVHLSSCCSKMFKKSC